MGAHGSKQRDIVAAVGLAVGGLFGLAGSFVAQASLRQVFWAIDGVALIVAAALLVVKYLRNGDDGLAASFLVFLVAEALVLSNTAAGLEASNASFASGIALWAASLVMTSLARSAFPAWTRLTGLIAAALFMVTAIRIFYGETILATAAPLPAAGYPFLVLTFAGWIWTLLRAARSSEGVVERRRTADVSA
jgi:NAD-dependent oxidoreductase involved in siderophore biosynthesis